MRVNECGLCLSRGDEVSRSDADDRGQVMKNRREGRVVLVGSSGCSRISDDEGLAHSELFHALGLASSATGCTDIIGYLV